MMFGTARRSTTRDLGLRSALGSAVLKPGGRRSGGVPTASAASVDSACDGPATDGAATGADRGGSGEALSTMQGHFWSFVDGKPTRVCTFSHFRWQQDGRHFCCMVRVIAANSIGAGRSVWMAFAGRAAQGVPAKILRSQRTDAVTGTARVTGARRWP